MWMIYFTYNQTPVFCQLNGVMLKLAKANWLFVQGRLLRCGRLNLNNYVVVIETRITTSG